MWYYNVIDNYLDESIGYYSTYDGAAAKKAQVLFNQDTFGDVRIECNATSDKIEYAEDDNLRVLYLFNENEDDEEVRERYGSILQDGKWYLPSEWDAEPSVDGQYGFLPFEDLLNEFSGASQHDIDESFKFITTSPQPAAPAKSLKSQKVSLAKGKLDLEENLQVKCKKFRFRVV